MWLSVNVHPVLMLVIHTTLLKAVKQFPVYIISIVLQPNYVIDSHIPVMMFAMQIHVEIMPYVLPKIMEPPVNVHPAL